jgi:hypothetical protein
MLTRTPRATAALLVMAALALVAATPGHAGSGRCSTSGQAVIKQMQQVIYFVPSKNEYRGCYAKTGRVTRLITRGFSTSGVVAHGTHATVLESPDAPPTGDVEQWQLSLWNVKTGKKFRSHGITADPAGSLELVDDVLGDPVTAVAYVEPGGTRVLDVIYDKGAKRLSTGAVKQRSTKVSGRKITWTEDGKKRSKRV